MWVDLYVPHIYTAGGRLTSLAHLGINNAKQHQSQATHVLTPMTPYTSSASFTLPLPSSHSLLISLCFLSVKCWNPRQWQALSYAVMELRYEGLGISSHTSVTYCTTSLYTRWFKNKGSSANLTSDFSCFRARRSSEPALKRIGQDLEEIYVL